ncbi:DNA mismatch repair protein MutS [Geosporobacter ferrireducens]|uniref:DNA mismatch repair protein MutS n=1 Tax=Geosporobacter ferrireducens TaxID=1424294 RepID=A0A1D8GQ56_9FIRM|nr:DNA mismatch repair protein MutS [Geosporobacter ferrireducens]AOT72924.1 DNA mismatch repair protein MutS [Geosporobacter ferrireducens]AOT73337.1 DNA mismatch repair protein MutS [Geosporobacter ferrireducens]MTI55332.1 DNA mismatch repair protein MutS [Geosporobacter ferrireducens]
MEQLTPMMKQYLEQKDQYPDCILFFRLGDFYEMFFEDAVLAAKELEIALTGRDCGLEERAPMCGVPYHAAENYISKLIDKGYKVAICEQVEDPSAAKGIVKREVIKVITPGTVIDPSMLKEKENNYIMAALFHEEGIGISYADISTGDLRVTEFTGKNVFSNFLNEAVKINPREIIINQDSYEDLAVEREIRAVCSQTYITKFDSWAYKIDYGVKTLKNHFHLLSLEGLGLQDHSLCTGSAGALLTYLEQTHKKSINHLYKIQYYHTEDYMVLDKTTRKNLELTETMRDRSRKGSLLWVLDKTNTAMGARLLKQWIEEPLTRSRDIQQRLDAVEALKVDLLTREDLKEYLRETYDLERLVGRISYGNANGRDLIWLKSSLSMIPKIKILLNSFSCDALIEINDRMNTHQEVIQCIEDAIVDDPPISLKDGGIIKETYHPEIFNLREAITKGKSWIVNLETEEKQKTGIKSLKIGYNKVFGYYIEVTKSNLGLVPSHYIRKQTLANAERYITPELKEIESKILGAEERITELEYQIFTEVREKVSAHTEMIQKTAKAIAILDVLISFADISDRQNYTKPVINEDHLIHIQNGRHPVVEKMMSESYFIPNDTLLDCKDNRFTILTGPNMAGKSTYMRQVSLIVLMAQIGCFVPADAAVIGIVDRIFTRVGASDDLAQGQSTFMVEMSELANIINAATPKSLILLDEIGRGTSTYDGLSIAWAVVEYISSFEHLGARTLFATHYHELTELEGILEGVKNYCIAVKEKGDDIIFLRKIIRGGADQSYGIQVAKLAGVSEKIVNRAKQILYQLEANDINKRNQGQDIKESEIALTKDEQLDLFHYHTDQIVSELLKIDVLNTTPLEAMNHLHRLLNMAKDCR